MSKTNPTMAIWLGKQFLDQRDNFDAQVMLEKMEDDPFKGLSTVELKGYLHKLEASDADHEA